MIRATFQEKFSIDEQELASAKCDRVKLAFRFKNSVKVEFSFISSEPTQVYCADLSYNWQYIVSLYGLGFVLESISTYML